MFEIINDHNCGYAIGIYKSGSDKEWHLSLDENELREDDQIINYCPMCGKRLSERYYDI